MKNIILALTATAFLAGCTTAEETAVVGGVAGAAIGGVAGDGEGAAIGAGAGAIGGYLLGRAADRPGYCRYRDRRTGRVYVERC
jgi:Glycine zipper/Prokaryotic membrane lipoprotein lipid attachment site